MAITSINAVSSCCSVTFYFQNNIYIWKTFLTINRSPLENRLTALEQQLSKLLRMKKFNKMRTQTIILPLPQQSATGIAAFELGHPNVCDISQDGGFCNAGAILQVWKLARINSILRCFALKSFAAWVVNNH